MLPLKFPSRVIVTVAVHVTVTVVIGVIVLLRRRRFLYFHALAGVAGVFVLSIADALSRFRWPLLLIVYRCRLLLSFIAYRYRFPLPLLPLYSPFPPLLLCGNSRGA